jgi:uncharacterized damage-inducible protein DinB
MRAAALLTIALVFGGHDDAWAQHAVRQSLMPQAASDSTTIKNRAAFREFIAVQRRTMSEAADAMPADKYGFAPSVGEFANVRTFSRQLKHLAATNFILAAAALGERAPADAGDEQGPDSVVTKAQHIAYLRASYDALDRAARAIGDERIPVGSSPISPFQGGSATRIALIAEALTHAYDHYGQIVVYLRMNGVIPPASRR